MSKKKSKREYILFIEDILQAIEEIEKYTGHTYYDEFSKNEMAVDAVIRNFEVIGEAVNYIPDNIKTKYPEVEWSETVGFRNVLIHNYFGIDVEAVWDTLKENIPGFKFHIKKVLDSEKQAE